MISVRLITDPFDLSCYSEHECDALMPFLRSQFDVWPETARLYETSIDRQNDITPVTEYDAAYVETREDGLYYVVVYPGDPLTIVLSVIAAIAVAAVILLLFTPSIPTLGTENKESANNSLGNRSNKPRPNGRVPDIFGTVISIPELLTVPLTFFENNVERELCYMCVGRGDHAIDAVKDGDTPIEYMAGAAAKFYGPFTSPNHGAPIHSVGGSIDKPLMDVIRINEVNGQTLRPPNNNQLSGNNDIRFTGPDTIENNGNIDFTKYFDTGDQLQVTDTGGGSGGNTTIMQSFRCTDDGVIEFESYNPSGVVIVGRYITLLAATFEGLTPSGGQLVVNLSGTYKVTAVDSTSVTLSAPEHYNAEWLAIAGMVNSKTDYRVRRLSYPTGASTANLSGTYNVVGVTAREIVLTNPALVNAGWSGLSGSTAWRSPLLFTNGERWVGPFIVDMPDCEKIVLNFTAQQGMYRINDEGRYLSYQVSLIVEIQPVDDDDGAIGSPVTYYVNVQGDGEDRGLRANTLWATLPNPGRCRVRARRTTPFELDTDDTIVDEVKWRDCYGAIPITQDHFGNLTTVHTLTLATNSALVAKERKLNCRATRKLLGRNNDNTFGPGLVASNNVADIICNMAIDPFIGGRDAAELDIEQIYHTANEVAAYFERADCATFNYTFDQDAVSFEEMVQAAARAAFCTAYRQGNKIKLFFERRTNDSILLFNHRNKLPGSEKRTVRFGYLGDNDGVEMDYVSDYDGAKLTVYIPENQGAIKPKKIDIVGIKSKQQAMIHAWRAYQKILFQNTTTEFSALAEASQLVVGERIEVTDNTRPDTCDGEVVAQNGLELEISQPLNAEPGADYTIQLQLESGIVEMLPVAPGADPYHVTLQQPASEPLVTDPENYARTTYCIVKASDNPPVPFMVSEKGSFDGSVVDLQAINYDARYYIHDQDYAE